MTAVEFATGAAAVSAAAAFATAVIGALRGRHSRQPLLMGHALNIGSVGYAVMRVTNIGLGAAVAPAIIGGDQGVGFAGHIGAGLMAPGESRLLHFADVARFQEVPMKFVLTCRGVDGRLYWTRGDEQHGARRVRGPWPLPAAVFREQYPNAALPDRIAGFQEESFPFRRVESGRTPGGR
jgi:hypothetical protein